MMWGCFQGNQLGPLVLFPSGKINAINYCNMLEENFIPFLQGLGSNVIFMEDGAPIHTANYSKTWCQNHGISSMKWPAQSPDLSPMENVWQQLKTALDKRVPRPKNKEELLIALQEEWKVLGKKNRLDTLIKSMSKCICKVISANGMPINY